MTIETLKEVIKGLESIEGVENAMVDDWNSYSASVFITVTEEALYGKLNKISGAIRRYLKKFGISKKNGTISGWSAPIKTYDKYSGIDYIEQDYYMLDIEYSDISTENFETPFTEDWYIFDKYNILGKNNKDLEEVFRSTYEKASDEFEHAEILEEHPYIAGKYDVKIFYKYEHTFVQYELSKSCRWDSGVIGVIIVKKDAKITPENIIEDINAELDFKQFEDVA